MNQITKERLEQLATDERNTAEWAVERRAIVKKALELWDKLEKVHCALDSYISKHGGI